MSHQRIEDFVRNYRPMSKGKKIRKRVAQVIYGAVGVVLTAAIVMTLLFGTMVAIAFFGNLW